MNDTKGKIGNLAANRENNVNQTDNFLVDGLSSDINQEIEILKDKVADLERRLKNIETSNNGQIWSLVWVLIWTLIGILITAVLGGLLIPLWWNLSRTFP